MIKSIPYLRRLVTLSREHSSSLSMLIRGIVYEECIYYRQISSYVSHRHSVFRLLIDVLKMPKGAMSTSQLQVRDEYALLLIETKSALTILLSIAQNRYLKNRQKKKKKQSNHHS